MGYMVVGVNSLQIKTHTHFDWVEIKRTTMDNKKAGTGNGTSSEIKWKIEALQASFKSTKWQRWVRQLRFSNGSLWYSSSPFSCLGLHLFVPCRFTLGQEVFGSSVVACLECYRESSSDGRPALPLSAVNPWKEKKGAENENSWLLMEINTSKWRSSSRGFARPSQVKLTVLGLCGNKAEIPYLVVTESINWEKKKKTLLVFVPATFCSAARGREQRCERS